MRLKRYYIDTSPLPKESQMKAINCIESTSYVCAYIPRSSGCYEAFWNENQNPANYPALFGCVVKQIP